MYIVCLSCGPLLEALVFSRTFRCLYKTCARPVNCLSSECCEIMSTLRSPNMLKHPVKRGKMKNLINFRLQSSGKTREQARCSATTSMVNACMCGNMNSRCLSGRPVNIRGLISSIKLYFQSYLASRPAFLALETF